jgi:hypothetical protein
MDVVIARFSRSIPRVLGLAAGGIALTILCGWVGFGAPSPMHHDWQVDLLGYVAMPLFGLATILFVVLLYRLDPIVEVSAFGIRDRRWRQQFVAWDAIDAISVRKVGLLPRMGWYLILRLHPEKDPGPDRGAMKWICMDLMDGSMADLLDVIRLARSHSRTTGAIRRARSLGHGE